jgi:hypothetical protein
MLPVRADDADETALPPGESPRERKELAANFFASATVCMLLLPALAEDSFLSEMGSEEEVDDGSEFRFARSIGGNITLSIRILFT